jgi:hypothetical protein
VWRPSPLVEGGGGGGEDEPVVGGGGAASVDTVGGDEVSVGRRCTRGDHVVGSHLSKWFTTLPPDYY